MKRDTTQYLHDIISAAEEAIELCPASRAEFDSSRRDQYSLIWLVQVVGEACARVSGEVREANPAIPWRAIVGARNRIVHGYFEIDPDVVWTVVTEHLPRLVPQIRAILATLPEQR